MIQIFFLLNHLWQSTLIAGLAWLVCETMLKANHPSVRFGVWLAASIKFLFPLALLLDLGQWLAPQPTLTARVQQVVFDELRGGNGGLAAAPFRVALAPQAPAEWQSYLLDGLLIVWAIGVGVVLLRWLDSWWTIYRATRDAKPSDPFRGVPVRQSRRLREQGIEPGVFGLWRPSILIPEGMEAALSAAQLDAVLAHEWNHVRRRDNLSAALQMLVEALFWFYPVVRMIGRKLIEERELACDQAVLDQAQAEDYAEGILNVCKLYRASPLACVPGISGADLRSRVALILRNQRPRALGAVRRWVLGTALLAGVAGPAVLGFLTGPAAFAQQANSFVGLATSADKKFEVATVKLNDSGEQRYRLGPPGNGAISIVNYTLRGLITQAFRTTGDRVFGGPDWIRDARYDIVAKGPDPKAANPEVWEMMRSLLLERFHLKYHIEDREMPVFALTISPRGLKLTPGGDGFCAADLKAGKNCGDILVPPFGTAMHNMPIGALITGIGIRAGRPIIDKTGLTGRYDDNVRWVPDGVKFDDLDLSQIPPEYRPPDVSIFDAIEQQAGLKLAPERAPIPVVVIESIDRPDPN